jgi:hypothetical protein
MSNDVDIMELSSKGGKLLITKDAGEYYYTFAGPNPNGDGYMIDEGRLSNHCAFGRTFYQFVTGIKP